MCKICRNENLKGLEYLDCDGCEFLTTIPDIKGLVNLICFRCPLITKIPHIDGLKYLNCSDCPSLTTIPNIEGLRELYCSNCPLLTTIPNIKGLYTLDCYDCELLTSIPNIEGLEYLGCYNCPLLITIFNIEGLKCLTCHTCPLLMYIPKCKYNKYDRKLLKLSYKGCKYLTSKKMDKLYNNIYYLWKSYKFKKYALYLQIHIYSNPRLPYMKYYIENELYNEGEASHEENKLKIGYMNSKHELIWYKF